jgi:guanylate kinase
VTQKRGLLVVLSGPSGVGKTSVADRLVRRPGFVRAVTATTRAPRPGETDGVDYHFLTDAEFAKGVAENRFLEHAEVHGRRYGTPKDYVERMLASGAVLLLVIDVQGAATLRKNAVDALYVFVAPPSFAELERRLRERKSESEKQVQARLATAKSEIARQGDFDTVVINDDLDRVVGEIARLVQARRQ